MLRLVVVPMLTVLMALAILGCGLFTRPPASNPEPPGQLIRSDKPHDTSPDVATADLEALVAGNTDFALALYEQVRGQSGNLFFSPYSISTALAMTYAGARGNTELQMATALHFTLPQQRLHPAFNKLALELARRADEPPEPGMQPLRLSIANATFAQRGFSLLDAFLDVLAESYDAGLYAMDFIGQPEESRQAINQWVSDATEERIPDIIPPGGIDAYTRLVLANAIYFLAAWENQFEKEDTANGPFTLLDGRQVNVPMMHQTEAFGYAEGQSYQAVELRYDGGQMAMVVLVPEAGSFETFESGLDRDQLGGILEAIQSRQVELTMPRFEFEGFFGLNDVLMALGMNDAFSPETADFSGITGGQDLFIGNVLHKAFVSVDEEGTEAAAATVVIMPGTSFPDEPVEVRIDRPFVFLIRDIPTETILFVGRVVDPSA